jgi:hypothetical protein
MSTTAPHVESIYTIEYTDTFGGEVNYSWMRHFRTRHIGTDRSLVRVVKKMLGLNGVRCDTYYHGDTIEIRPRGMCTVAFIYYVGDVA